MSSTKKSALLVVSWMGSTPIYLTKSEASRRSSHHCLALCHALCPDASSSPGSSHPLSEYWMERPFIDVTFSLGYSNELLGTIFVEEFTNKNSYTCSSCW